MWDIAAVVIIVALVLALAIRAFCRAVAGKTGHCSCDCSESGRRPCESGPASRKTPCTDRHSAR
jgi:hypothetical protein